MNTEKEEREVDIMAAMKLIQATPELSGKDATKLMEQANMNPTKQAMHKNNMLRNVLLDIQKA